MEGRIRVELPEFACDACGAKSVVFPYNAAARCEVFYSIGLLAAAHASAASVQHEAYCGALQQVHLRNKCAKGPPSKVLGDLDFAAKVWSLIREQSITFHFAEEPTKPSPAADAAALTSPRSASREVPGSSLAAAAPGAAGLCATGASVLGAA